MSANSNPWAKSGLPPAYVNKVLLEHSLTHSFHIVYGCFPSGQPESDRYSKGRMADKACHIYSLALHRRSLLTLLSEIRVQYGYWLVLSIAKVRKIFKAGDPIWKAKFLSWHFPVQEAGSQEFYRPKVFLSWVFLYHCPKEQLS
jgi:hypothetical protein